MRWLCRNHSFTESEIVLFGLSVCRYGTRTGAGGNEKYISLFPQQIIARPFLDSVLKTAGEGYDYYFLVRTAGIGEAYLLNFMYKRLQEKLGFKNACIVTHRRAYQDMYRQFLPQVPCYVTEGGIRPYNDYLNARFLQYKHKVFQVIHCTLPESDRLFKNYVKGYDVPYPEVIKKWAGVDRFIENRPQFSAEDKAVVEKVAGLNLDKFILLIPEANNVKPRSNKFWPSLAAKLKEKGYDIYVNTKDGICSYGMSADIPISQVAYLASLAKGIVSIRAGLLEYVSTFDNPKHVIYGEHVWHPLKAGELMKTSSLCYYPMVDKKLVFEYNPDEMSEEKIIEQIAERF
ncbi:MAG: hypothetical protein IKO35_04375 [Elusimicrobiaceae bacterium]|nr:hypothetical protein [Elusimicrobiaceae bacterium]